MTTRVYLSPSKQAHNWSVLGVSEEDLMAPVAEACRAELVLACFDVRLHQGRTIQNAATEANAWPANVYVAIHSNALSTGPGRGTEVFYHTVGYPGEILAACIQSEIVATFDAVSRGIKDLSRAPVRYYEITEPKMTSVLVETLFHTNRGETLLLRAYPEDMGLAIARGIITFAEHRFGAVSRQLAGRLEQALTYIPR